MAERVLVASLRNRRTPVLMDVRLARHLVARGSYEYAGKEAPAPVPANPVPTKPGAPPKPPARKKAEEAEKVEKPAPKKRTYKRRDMKAED